MDEITAAITGLTGRLRAYRGEIRMGRLEEKLKQARGVVGRQTAKIEARADAIIAQEAVIEALTHESFAGHEAMLKDAQAGLDALKRELGQLTNDPLGGSGGSPAVDPAATFRE